MNIVALPLMGQYRKASLSDQVGQAIGGGDVARCQAGQAGSIKINHISMGSYLLTVLIDEKYKLCIRIGAQTPNYRLELIVLLFIHYDGSRHHFSSSSLLMDAGPTLMGVRFQTDKLG